MAGLDVLLDTLTDSNKFFEMPCIIASKAVTAAPPPPLRPGLEPGPIDTE
jgi:hypothetical protein